MNIDRLRSIISSYIDKDYTFLYQGMRGQNEKFVGRVIKIYPRTFLIKTNHGYIKSFSYSDFLLKILRVLP